MCLTAQNRWSRRNECCTLAAGQLRLQSSQWRFFIHRHQHDCHNFNDDNDKEYCYNHHDYEQLKNQCGGVECEQRAVLRSALQRGTSGILRYVNRRQKGLISLKIALVAKLCTTCFSNLDIVQINLNLLSTTCANVHICRVSRSVSWLETEHIVRPPRPGRPAKKSATYFSIKEEP